MALNKVLFVLFFVVVVGVVVVDSFCRYKFVSRKFCFLVCVVFYF